MRCPACGAEIATGRGPPLPFFVGMSVETWDMAYGRWVPAVVEKHDAYFFANGVRLHRRENGTTWRRRPPPHVRAADHVEEQPEPTPPTPADDVKTGGPKERTDDMSMCKCGQSAEVTHSCDLPPTPLVIVSRAATPAEPPPVARRETDELRVNLAGVATSAEMVMGIECPHCRARPGVYCRDGGGVCMVRVRAAAGTPVKATKETIAVDDAKKGSP